MSSSTSSRARKQAQPAAPKKRNGTATPRRARKRVERAADEFIAKNAEILAELAK